ncbi:MAG: hypothetical protein D6812_15810 [Deltaproteobacteria bacterium]|nr:MAG: hypothetical protein D6812_15810 [Deltaproteobacteria bacterium]
MIDLVFGSFGKKKSTVGDRLRMDEGVAQASTCRGPPIGERTVNRQATACPTEEKRSGGRRGGREAYGQ